jgi:3-oxoacyl-[acyl-carrier-protein] synthase-3
MTTNKAYIKSTGHYLPKRVIENSYFEDFVETNDTWIRERTGIERRHWVSDDESTATIAGHAARQALEASGLEANDIDLIIVGTATPERLFPSTACFVQQEIGATKPIPGFDLTAACCGFQFAAATATQFVRSGMYKNVLVIGAETLSRIVDMSDRGSCILFGDGAGAAIISSEGEHEILDSKMFADGQHGDLITRKMGSKYPVTQENIDAGHNFVTVQGRDVYRIVVKLLPEVVKDSVESNGYELKDLTWILAHQMNLRILEASSKRLDIPMDQYLTNIADTGNTSSASIPILMDQANRSGKLKKGDLVSIVAFGGGLTWGSLLVRW